MGPTLISYLLIPLVFAIAYANRPASSVPYFPPVLQSTHLTYDEVKMFVHTASYLMNSRVMELETKYPGFSVLDAIRDYQRSKVGQYFHVILRIWAKFSDEDRLKNRMEVYSKTDTLTIPSQYKEAMKGLYEHVNSLQKTINTAAKCKQITPAPTTIEVPTTPEITTTEATTPVPESPPNPVIFEAPDSPVAIH